jgi:Protein of unknown function VcgC/VcgE (DUF2780)
MNAMTNRIRITLIAVCLFAYVAMLDTKYAQAQTPTAETADSKNPSPELIGKLTKELSITPEQAIGGSGAIFGLAKTKLKPEEFTRVADAVPGMDGLLKAAPKPKKGAAGALGAMGGMLPGKAGSVASLAGSFKSLGLSADMAGKFVPIMTQFVQAKGGASVGNLLAGALK